MLSEDLRNLAARMRQMKREGTVVTPDMLDDMATVTDVLADSAGRLEREPVPFEARHEPALGLDPRVVPLRRFAVGDLQ